MAVSVDDLLRKAQSNLKAGKISEAAELYKQVLSRFPKNKRAILGYQKVKVGITSKDQLSSDPPQEKLQELSALNNHGQFEETLSKLKPLVSVFPKSVALRHIQAASNTGLKKYDAAIESYKRALKIKPYYFAAYFNMGNILKEQGRHKEAIEAYKKTLSLKPDYAEAYYNIGNAHKEQGKLEEAIEAYSQALYLKPDYPEAYLNMGNALQEQGELEEAIEAYSQALYLKPDYPEAYLNMGNALQEQGELEEAIEAYKKTLSLKPDYPEAYFNMGNILKEQGMHEKAIEAYKKTLSLKPDYAEAYNNTGNILKEQGMHEEAIEAYKKTLSLKPDYAETYTNMGNAHEEQGELEKAIEAYNKALAIKPDHESARSAKLYQQAHICDWDSISEQCKLIPKLGTSNNFIQPFLMLSLEDAPERHRLRSEVYAKANYPQKPLPLPAKPTKKPKRLRIGYFSADFQEHPVAFLIAKVFEKHDRDEFEVLGYSLHGSSASNMRQRLKNSFDCFTDVQSMSDKDIALLARQDKIDIAIDLNGYTQNARTGIFAYRAAPVQISYLGYPGTLGADFIDYIIADENLIPTTSQKYYSEKPIYLPHHYQAQDDSSPIPNDTPSRSALGLPEKGFVFCAHNGSYKITSSQFSLWMRLLQNVDGSVLWLLENNKWVKANLLKEANARGIASQRLVFAQKVPHEKYLAQFRQADLYLDTFICNAGATASNALWAGLPILTKLGKGYTARMAGSLLQSLGLQELITTTEGEYEHLALELAKNPQNLSIIKKKLADNRLSKPLFDTKLFTKHLEDGYQQAYQNYFDGKAPKAIIVQK